MKIRIRKRKTYIWLYILPTVAFDMLYDAMVEDDGSKPTDILIIFIWLFWRFDLEINLEKE